MPLDGSFALTRRALSAAVASVFLIAGAAWPAGAPRYAIRNLGTLGGTFDPPLGINAAGRVVGNSNVAGDQFYHAVLFTDGLSTDLGTFGGATSRTHAINGAGQIVRAATPAGTKATHAFLWENGVMKDLNALIPGGTGWLLDEAYNINASGQIIGTGFFQGAERPFLLTPATP
jgi:probable HAF family extracellular repeat protein